MDFAGAIQSGFSNYANFSARACRSEFWHWTLFAIVVNIATAILDRITGAGFIGLVVSLALLIPSIAVGARRLHDIDRTGWWLLLAFTVIGGIVLIVWYCTKGTTGPTRFGADPLMGA
ncbi:MAG: DUF805 domain-containing protein [Terriglobia bacterium]